MIRMSYGIFSRPMTIHMSFKFRKCLPPFIAPSPLFSDEIWRYEEKKVTECTRSTFVLGRSGTGYVEIPFRRSLCNSRHGRKTTAIVFKIFGIERAWRNLGCVGPRPRQLFVTKSRLLAEKVERDYVNLLYSLSAGPDAPLYVRERIQRWTSRRKEIFNPDDTDGGRDDLPEKFSELRDSDFPLFLTMDTVGTSVSINGSSTDGDCICICSFVAF